MAGHRSHRGGARRRPHIWVLVLALLLSACVAAPPAGSDDSAGLAAYRLGPGDRLKVTVFGQPELSGEFDIDGSGAISYPLLGAVVASDRPVRALEREMAAALDLDFIVDPRVSIEVVSFRPFYVLGQVNRPGGYPYVVGLSVRQAVAIAGGYTRRANETGIVLVRRTAAGETLQRVPLSSAVLPGDTLEIQRRLF